MAIKTLYLGSEGPFKYDDTELVNDPDGLFSGVLQRAIVTDGVIDGTLFGGFQCKDLDSSHLLDMKWNEDDVADRILNFLVNAANRTINLSDDLVVSAGAGDLDQDVSNGASPAFDATNITGGPLNNDSMADALHRHSELSASDGTPNPALSVDADGNVGINTTDLSDFISGILNTNSRVVINNTSGETSFNADGSHLTLRNSDPYATNNRWVRLSFAGWDSVNSAVGAAIGMQITQTTSWNRNILAFFTAYDSAPVEQMRITGKGAVGIGVIVPTAVLHLKAGAAGAGLAPLKLTSGPVLTTPEAGAVDFLTDDLSFTITTGVARKQIVLTDGSVLTSGKIPKASTNGRLVDGPTPLAGTKVYYVSDTSGGAVTRKLTFTDGILTAET